MSQIEQSFTRTETDDSITITSNGERGTSVSMTLPKVDLNGVRVEAIQQVENPVEETAEEIVEASITMNGKIYKAGDDMPEDLKNFLKGFIDL